MAFKYLSYHRRTLHPNFLRDVTQGQPPKQRHELHFFSVTQTNEKKICSKLQQKALNYLQDASNASLT